ncbi:MAG: hypothetical protein R3B06_17750 [Kofleriaceae bacterium]
MKLGACLLVAALAVASAARADVVSYASHGASAASAADARTRALDLAFASAVTEAVADLAGSAARVRADVVDAEIIRRARRFVGSFSVSAERTVGDRLELDVTVRVDVGKLAARLVELGVELRPTPPPPPPVVAARAATILYRVTGVGAPAATFGAAARTDVPGLDALAAAVASAGFRVVAPTAAGPAPGDGGQLPVDDGGARTLAGEVQADLAVVAGVAVGAPGRVRGTPLVAAPVRAWLRVVDADGAATPTPIAVATAAWGNSERVAVDAADAAARALAARAFGRPAPTAPTTPGDRAPALRAARGVTVRLTGAGAWQAALLVRADLTAAPGVKQTSYAGVSADEVVLAVDGISVDKAASIAKATPGFAARTRVVDGAVVVEIKSIGGP